MRKKRVTTAMMAGLAMSWLLLTLMVTGKSLALDAAEVRAQQAAFPNQRDAVQQAALWLVTTHQNEDGGYTSFSTGANQADSDVGGTLDAILALSSAGFNPSASVPGKPSSPVDYLLQNIDPLISFASVDAGQAGKVVMALAAAGQNPRDFGGSDFVTTLLNHRSFAGYFDVENAFKQSLAILALSAVHEPIPEPAVTWLLDQQADGDELDGSWDDGFGTSGNTDATAMSIMALVASEMTQTNESLARAATFLTRTQIAGGGWEYAADFGENVNSTALAIQALKALGHDFYTAEEGGSSPLVALLSWQSESGAFQADFGDGRFDDFFSTVQALPAAAGKTFPLPARLKSARRAVTCLASLQDPVTGGWEQFTGAGVNAAGTSRVIQAIVAVGEDPRLTSWVVGETSALQALENLTPDYLATSAGGGAGIILQGVVASGADPGNFAGRDLVLEITRHLSPTGEYDDTSFGPFSHAEAMLGLLQAGEVIDTSAVDWLLNAQTEGDWGSPDANGIALNLIGRLGETVPAALDVLHATQEADGGWGYGSTNPSSSSEVVQGLVAVGENPFGPMWSQVVSGTVTNAADVVMALQGESGCWPNLFGPGEDVYGTTDAVLLLVQQPGWGLPEATLTDESSDEADELATPVQESEPLPEATATPETEPTPEPAEVRVEPTEEDVPPATATSADDASPESGSSGSMIPIAILAVAAIAIVALAVLWRYRA